MATYYVDLAANFVNRTGADNTTNVLTGPGGLQAAIRGWGNATALAAADILYLKGTADLSKFVRITVDVDKTGTWAIGDAVQNHNDGGGASGDDWVGVLVHITATILHVQINAASSNHASVSTADGVDNTTQSETIAGANMTAKACPGIIIDTASGSSAAGRIQLRGVNSSWADDNTQATLDGNSQAADGLYMDNTRQHYYASCITVTGSAGDGFRSSTYGLEYWVLDRCRFINNATYGIDQYIRYATFIRCVMSNNGSSGLHRPYGYNHFIFCRLQGNGDVGIDEASGGSVCIGCLMTGNTNGAFGRFGAWAFPILFLGCVADGNGDGSGDHGLHFDGPSTVLGTRITHHDAVGKLGIYSQAAASLVYENWNVFYDNTANVTAGTLGGAGSVTDSADDGYENRAGGDYNVKSGADIRSTAVTLFWDS